MTKIVSFFRSIFATLSTDNRKDSDQAKTGRYLLRFFAGMLVLTLIARGTAGATLARVQITSPSRGQINQVFYADGQIAMAKENVIACPANLKVEQLLIDAGANVQTGDALMRFSPEEVDTAVQTLRAEISKLQAQLAALRQGVAVDSTGLAAAQTALDWAVQDRDAARATLAGSLSAAQAEQNAAQTALDELTASLGQNSIATSEGSLAADGAPLAEAQARLDAAVAGVHAAGQALANFEATADRGVGQAHADLANAQASKAEAETQAKLQNQLNAADGEILALSITQAQNEYNALLALQKSDYTLFSEFHGVLTRWDISAGESTGVTLGSIANDADGWAITFQLSEAQAQQLMPGANISATQAQRQENAKITTIASADTMGQCLVTALIQGESWRAGRVNVSIAVSQTDYQTCLPAQAVHSDNGGDFIYIVEQKNTILGLQNIVVKLPVTVPEQAEGLAAISGNVAAGDTVVLFSDKAIKAGDRVRVTQ